MGFHRQEHRRGFPWPKDRTWVSCVPCGWLSRWATQLKNGRISVLVSYWICFVSSSHQHRGQVGIRLSRNSVHILTWHRGHFSFPMLSIVFIFLSVFTSILVGIWSCLAQTAGQVPSEPCFHVPKIFYQLYCVIFSIDINLWFRCILSPFSIPLKLQQYFSMLKYCPA